MAIDTRPKTMKCPTCRSDISKQAGACPKCGHQFRKAGAFDLGDPVHLAGAFIAAFIGLSAIMIALQSLGLL
jgi:hypothetical protein